MVELVARLIRGGATVVDEVNLHLTPRSTGFACSVLVTEIDSPDPVGRLLFVNHLPDWQLGREYERERQTTAVARFLEERVSDRPIHVIVAGDLDATPDAASIRFWSGKQSLDDLSVCYRDAWSWRHPEDATGHTFTPDNALVRASEWGSRELGRRIDYILVRCTEHGPTLAVTSAGRLFDRPVGGVWASDHFGVTADLAVA